MFADGHIDKKESPEARTENLKGLLAVQFSGMTQLLADLPPEIRSQFERKLVAAELLSQTIIQEIRPR